MSTPGTPIAAPPLAGLRVLELARILAGPWIGQTLGDLGAEVIKVESPQGDDTRRWGPPFVEATGSAAYFHAANRGKRSVACDFADPGDLALVKDLAARADVLIENFKVGGLERFGLDAPSLRAASPRLIYCSVTGFGQTGPYASRAGYDFLIQGMSGLMSVTGEEGREPQKVGVAVTDLATGLYGVIAIQSALLRRAGTGEGAHIDMSLLDCATALMANQAQYTLVTGRAPPRLGNAHPAIVPYQVFEAADGPLIVAVGNDGQFARFCELIGLPDLPADPRFATNPARVGNRDLLVPMLADAVGRADRAELLAAMEARTVPGGPIFDMAEALADPQAAARGLAIEPGGLPALGTPIVMDGRAMASPRPAPRLDEHGEEIRARGWD